MDKMQEFMRIELLLVARMGRKLRRWWRRDKIQPKIQTQQMAQEAERRIIFIYYNILVFCLFHSSLQRSCRLIERGLFGGLYVRDDNDTLRSLISATLCVMCVLWI